MYTGYGFRTFEIGDVDVVWHDGWFHLFHLVLPNHDYIAHAVSEDGLRWRRVENALFIGDPGGWDDDMLWTMHVSPDPHASPERPGWRMFYTGLTMAERGRVQRIGLATSDDLYRWTKVDAGWPLELTGPPYEHRLDQGRHWVSFRDPFYLRYRNRGWLLACARVADGPLIRRGCVALAEEIAPDRFRIGEPLFHPGRYDDIEVPAVVELGGRCYLIGSTREDIKVHYWYADALDGPWRNFQDNVLLPQGNYAARVSRWRDRSLLWNFFASPSEDGRRNQLPPPKELVVNDDGELRLRSHPGFDGRAVGREAGGDLLRLDVLVPRASCTWERDADELIVEAGSGFQAFLLPGERRDLRLEGTLRLERPGKPGFVLRLDAEGNGYYLSLDLAKGLAQLRAWGRNPGGDVEDAFRYTPLQSESWVPGGNSLRFRLIAYGSYLELSIAGEVVLTLADGSFREGRVGVYLESGRLRLAELVLTTLDCPDDAGLGQN